MVDKLLHLITLLTTLPEIEEAIDRFLEELATSYQAERAYIIEYDFANRTLSNTYEWCAPGISSEKELLQNIDLSVVDDWNRRFEEQGDFYISALHQQLDKNSEDYRLLEMQGVNSLMAAPITRKGKVVGFLGVDNPGEEVVSSELLRATVHFLMVELEKRRMMHLAEELSSTDTLTGAKNRRSYIDMLQRLEINSPRTIGFINADINGLHRINEIFGYDFGDEAVKRTAEVLQEYAGKNVYRISGDEFAAIVQNVEEEDFEDLCRRLRAAYQKDEKYAVSVGSSWVECQGYVNLQQQYKKIHELMTADKAQHLIDARYEVGLLKRGDLTINLLKEIEEGRFQVYLQPQVNLETGEITGAEALMRKFDDQGRMIPPMQFIPQYEVLGLQMHLDRFVLRSVVEMLAGIPEEKRLGSVSVNISRAMMEMPNFVREVETLLKEHHVAPKYLRLEITESVAQMGFDLLKTVVNGLQDIGVKVALDDFGTEYSNLSALINIDFDEVKLDKSLVDGVCDDHKAQTVLKNVINMCRELGDVHIVAEGIEEHPQREKIKQMQCGHGQGFLFHKPMPMQDYLNIILGDNTA